MQYELGQQVDFTRAGSLFNGNVNRYLYVDAGTPGVVTQATTTNGYTRVRASDVRDQREISVLVTEEWIKPADPNIEHRTIGQVPNGGISPHHPDLKWLWEDAARVATQAGYCPVYDEICKKLGIPGRPKNYTASIKIGASTITGKFLCHSVEEAKKLLIEDLAKNGVTVSLESEVTVTE